MEVSDLNGITIKREQTGPFVTFLVDYKGVFVGSFDADETPNPFFESEKLGKRFLADLKKGNVGKQYLNL